MGKERIAPERVFFYIMIIQTVYTNGDYEGFVTIFDSSIEVYSIGIIHYGMQTNIFGYPDAKIYDGDTCIKTWINPDKDKIKSYISKCTRII